jgi:uroporphyrin-3 C-methyltransferase
MSDDDPKPGVVIDVEPEPASRPSAPGADQQPVDEPSLSTSRQTGGAGRLALVIGVVAALAVLGVGGLGYWQLQQFDGRIRGIDQALDAGRLDREALQQAVLTATDGLNRQRDTLEEQQAVLARQRHAVEEARVAFEAQEKRLADENLRLQEREAVLRAAVADVHRRVGRSGSEWIVAETAYLLRIANHRLNLARDTATARVALELADQRLRDTGDPGWAGVREQLARDIAALAAFSAPDLAGLAARLSAAIELVPQLTVARATIGPARTPTDRVDRDPETRSWDTLLEDLLSGFKDAVRIRERDQPVAAMLAPEHEYFLYENLKLRLETARLALSRGERALYRDNLDTAAQWLNEHFADDAVSTSLKATIADLGAFEIQPPLPDISQSLRALQVRRRLLADLVPQEAAAAPAPTPAENRAP